MTQDEMHDLVYELFRSEPNTSMVVSNKAGFWEVLGLGAGSAIDGIVRKKHVIILASGHEDIDEQT